MKKLIAAAIVAASALALTGCSPAYDDSPTTDCTVTGKYTAIVDKSTQKRLETSCGIFTVDDEPFHGAWNSADTYARIEVGKTYDFVAYGYRNGFFSLFPNVTEAVEVTP